MLRSLGVDNFPFKVKGSREAIVPERVAVQERRKQLEDKRLRQRSAK